MDVEVLDPRRDPEPSYWAALRSRARLRADWAWEVLTAQGWATRDRLLITVLHGTDGPCGVVCAGWVGLPGRRDSFAPLRGGPWLGGLHVRSPGTGAVPGWWFADGQVSDLLAAYAKAMRRELGIGCQSMLLRQVDDALLTGLPGLRLVRPTEPVWMLPIDGLRDEDEWLATLSRNRRRNLRQIARRIERDERIEVSIGTGAAVDPTEAAWLLRQHDEKYRGPLVTPVPQVAAYLAALFRQQDVMVTSYTDRDTGRLLGFSTTLDHPEWPSPRHWAALPEERNLYFYDYLAGVRWAIAQGRPGMALGRGMGEVKRTLGAQPVAQYAVLVSSYGRRR